MPIAAAPIIGGIIGAGGAITGAAIAAHGAGSAADTQAQAANSAAQLQYQAEQNALGFQQQQYNNALTLGAPYYSAGLSGLVNLENLLGVLPASAATTPIPNPTALAGNKSASVPAFPGSVPNNGRYAGTGGASGSASQAAGLPPGHAGSKFLVNDAVASRNSTPILPGGKTLNIGNPNLVGKKPLPTQPTAQPGTQNLSSLINPALGAKGSLLQPWGQTFTAPQLNNTTDPGYLARLQLGTDAVQKSAAARGGLISGGTARDLAQFGQDYASSEYGNVYNRALNTYNTNYNTFENNQANTYNRLASLAGLGQVQANDLSTYGLNTANNVGNILLGSAGQIGNQLNNAAAARGSGYVGSANAYAGALGNLGNLGLLYSLYNQGGAAFPGLTPGQISASAGGPGTVATEPGYDYSGTWIS